LRPLATPNLQNVADDAERTPELKEKDAFFLSRFRSIPPIPRF
jgi:hypothetical protein